MSARQLEGGSMVIETSKGVMEYAIHGIGIPESFSCMRSRVEMIKASCSLTLSLSMVSA